MLQQDHSSCKIDKRLQGGQGERRDTSKQAATVMQVGDYGGLDKPWRW